MSVLPPDNLVFTEGPVLIETVPFDVTVQPDGRGQYVPKISMNVTTVKLILVIMVERVTTLLVGSRVPVLTFGPDVRAKVMSMNV